MNKYQEALEILKNIQITTFGNSDLIESAYKEEVETIEQALQRLESIDNAKPSEALECVGVLKEEGCITTLVQGKILETIRQYILKAQEQEKVLRVIKNIIKFGDDLNSILDFDTYEEYCKHSCDYDYELTQEEFNFLKEVTKNE